MCICQTLESCLFSVSLSVPILSLIAVLYVLLLIRVCHSLFVGAVGVGWGVGECFYPTTIILSLIVRVNVHLLIRVSLCVFSCLSVCVRLYYREFHVCEKVRSAHPACNSAIDLLFFCIFSCIRPSLGLFVFPSLFVY